NLRSFDDLVRARARLSNANPGAAAIGKMLREALKRLGRWEAIKSLVLVEQPTVNDVANDVKLRAVDAGFVWDTTVRQYPDLEAVALPELKGVTANVPVSVLKSCKQPAAALRFARYLAARDRGLLQFARFGFTPVE